MDDGDRRQYRGEAAILLAKRSWTAGDVDQAAMIHDLLEVPGDAPDPAAVQLRARLTGELAQRLGPAENPLDRLRYVFFSLPLLDAPDVFWRRLFRLLYRAMTSLLGYQDGARGQLDVAIEAFLELDRRAKVTGPRTRDFPGPVYDSALNGLAAACYMRYASRRDVLHGDLPLPPDKEREIREDLDQAIDASRRVASKVESSVRAVGLALLGSCYALRYEDDPRYSGPETINTAVARLWQALRLAEAAAGATGQPLPGFSSPQGIRDRLAAALVARETVRDIDTAIGLYLRNRDEAASSGRGNSAGEWASLATAYARRWLLTREPADQVRVREAYAEAFAAGETPAAFDIVTQWGGLAWKERWWAEAGAAYQQATRVVHLAVRQQGSRSDREWIVRKTPGIAARAALGLARAGAPDDALVALETGRAVLLTEMFDRRAIDYDRIALLAGYQVAGEYQQLTDDLTQLEAQLLLAGSQGDRAISAGIEEKRRQRMALRARMGDAARKTLTVMDGPPTGTELRQAAGPATVVYLAATGQGGLALILHPGGAPVEAVELEDLTAAAAVELAAALGYAAEGADFDVCDEVCWRLWRIAMERLLPKLAHASEVVLIPGGVLAALPWHAAKLPGRSGGYVLDVLAVSYMPNIRALPVARAAREGMPRRLRALAVEAPEPTSGQPLDTAAEIAAIQAHGSADFQVTRLPGAEATIGRLRGDLARYELLHFAGHAFADVNDPLAGALVLAHDECLTIRELLASGIGAGRFAVLSACETARVEDIQSDEMVSLPTALVQCGFSGVVGSLWAAADKPASMLMRAFYEQWRGNGAAPREALRAAQQYTRERRYASPLAWANFVYVGP